MSDPVKGCVVAFETALHEDYARALCEAIRLLKGVGSVTTSVVTTDDWINREQERRKFVAQLRSLLGENT